MIVRQFVATCLLLGISFHVVALSVDPEKRQVILVDPEPAQDENFRDANSGAVDAAKSGGSLVFNGSHSRPVSRLVAVGEITAWVAGDWGQDKHDTNDGDLGMAEVSVGRNFGFAQVNVSLGKTWAEQNLNHDGEIDADGRYVMVEGIVPIAGKRELFATVGAYRHWGETDIKRGYLNGAAVEYSHSDPDSDSWGVRVRLDWANAFTKGNAVLSPYADLWYSETELEGYTETGGTAPSQFNKSDDSITELRVGLNMVAPIEGSELQLIANLAQVHRFDENGNTTSGQVVGGSSFSLAGEEYDQSWTKLGAGVEGAMWGGKGALMLNATTSGEMSDLWIAFSYQTLLPK